MTSMTTGSSAVTSETSVTLGAQATLAGLVKSVHEIRGFIEHLERHEKALLIQLKPLVDPKFDLLPKAVVVVAGMELSRTASISRSISADVLIDRGVPPDIIAAATKTDSVFCYAIRQQ